MLAKPEHENRISHICTDNVKTGIANTLGEQGGGYTPLHCDVTGFHFLGSPQSWVTQMLGSPSFNPPRVYTSTAGPQASTGRIKDLGQELRLCKGPQSKYSRLVGHVPRHKRNFREHERECEWLYSRKLCSQTQVGAPSGSWEPWYRKRATQVGCGNPGISGELGDPSWHPRELNSEQRTAGVP